MHRNHATLALAAAPNFICNVQQKDRSNPIFYPQALNGDPENFYGTIPDGQHEMGQAMFALLYPSNGSTIPIGDASRQAKVSTNDQDVHRTWILFGDPTLKIR